MSDTRFTIDARQAFSELDGIDRALSELEVRFKRFPVSVREGFRSNLTGQFDRSIQQAKNNTAGLKAELDQVPAKTTAAFNPKQAQDYAKAVASAEKAVEQIGDAQGPRRVNQEIGTGAALFRGLIGAAAAAGAALSFGDAVKTGLELNAQYEKVKTSLKVILGDSQKAEDLLGKLNRFSAQTPFQPEQINKAATALLAFGESEETVIDRLREIGDLSSATGKDFNELATIYGKARVAGVLFGEDINQLVEAGIPIIGEFAKQLGVSESQVKKLASEGKIGFGQLQTAFTSLTSEGGRFAGFMREQSETAEGLRSTLLGVFGDRLRQATEGFANLVKEATKGLIGLLDNTKKESVALEEQRIKFLALSNEVRLANDGSQRRSDLIAKLQTQYPQFLGNVDKEKVTNEQLQPILDNINKSYIIRIALQKQQEKIQPLLEAQAEAENRAAEKRAQQNELLVRAAEITGVNIVQIKDQEKQIQAVTLALQKQARFGISSAQDRLDRENRLREPLNEQARLLGEILALGGQTAVTAKSRAEAESEVTEAQRQSKAIADELKKTYGEVFDLATGATESATNAGESIGVITGKPGKSAADIEFERREKDLQKRRLLLNDMEDGLEKEIEIIRLHFEQLRLEYDKAGLDTAKLIEKQAEAEISATVDFLAASTEADSEALERRRRTGEAILAVRRDELEAEKEARDAQIDLAEERGKQLALLAQRSGANEKQLAEGQRQFQLATQKARLESELVFQEALLTITDAGNAEQANQIRRTIALIREQLKSINIEINTPVPESGNEGKPKGLLGLFGIQMDDDDAAIVEDAAQRIVASLQQVAAARLADAQAAVDAADQRVEAAESALEQELRLAEAGFASNTTLRQQELAEAKRVREQAIRDQQKAARAQLIVDASIQAGNIVTSTTNLIKSWSTLPFGIGLVAAFAQVAGLVAFIANIRARARQISSQARYGKSGFLDGNNIVQGRTHAQGGEHLEVERGELVQVADDGGRRRIEVVRRERAREYMDLLLAANKGDREAVAIHALKLADIKTLSEGSRNRIFKYYMDAGSQAVSHTGMYPVEQDGMRQLIFGDSPEKSVSVVIQGDGSKRTNELLERMLAIMAYDSRKEKWSPDGKTRIKGNVKTRYIG